MDSKNLINNPEESATDSETDGSKWSMAHFHIPSEPITSEDHINKRVKEVMRMLMCQSILKLRAEMQDVLKDEKNELETKTRLLEKLKNLTKLITSKSREKDSPDVILQNMLKSQGDYAGMEQKVQAALEHLVESIAETKQIIAHYKAYWEYVRTAYRKFVEVNITASKPVHAEITLADFMPVILTHELDNDGVPRLAWHKARYYE